MKYLYLLLLFIPINLFATEPTLELFIPWGGNEINVNFRDEPGSRFGPQSFQVSGHFITILDPGLEIISRVPCKGS